MPFSPVGFWAAAGGASPTVSPSTSNLARSDSVGPVYCCLQYSSDGYERYNNTPTNIEYNNSARGLWLDSGSASAVWLERTINSGTLHTDPGAGRLNLGSSRSFVVEDTSPLASNKQCNLTMDFWDAASGGTKIGTATFTLTASYFDSCPTCCFTPETLVTMADGSLIPISEVQVGDMIRVMNGIEQITEIITRVSRPMCRLTFANGKELLLTSDHPVFVEGKGYASVRPQMEYKDAGQVKQLETGDFVVTDTGLRIRITSITPYDYLDTVYTLGNKHFFAGGILVY